MKNTAADPPPVRVRRPTVDGGFLVLAAFTATAGALVALTRGAGRAVQIVAETAWFVAILSPKIAAGIFIAATLPLLMPRDRVAQWIGRASGWRGLALAAAAGAAIPGGPMMTFPLAAGFVAAGADMGAVVAFVSGWSLLGLNRTLIWEFSFLPADLVWTRYLLCLPFPLLLGYGARRLARCGPPQAGTRA